MAEPRIPLTQEQIDTAMKSPEHLRAWLDASGRRWLVFDGVELVKALPWPHGVEAFMQVIAAYRDERQGTWTGRMGKFEGKNAITGETISQDIKIMKGEHLEVEELDRAIRYLIGQITELDPTWSIEKPAL